MHACISGLYTHVHILFLLPGLPECLLKYRVSLSQVKGVPTLVVLKPKVSTTLNAYGACGPLSHWMYAVSALNRFFFFVGGG